MGGGTLDLQINNPRETARVNPELLEAITFGRTPQLDKVTSALREFASGKKPRHFVFIGPRGAGKTHMLMMVKRRIETDAELREALMPVEYPEETYAVMSEADFVRQTVEAVWEVDEHAKAIMGPMPWERERWVFEEGAEAKAVQAGLKGLREYCRASKRSLVLLVDNLDTLLHKASGLENVLKERFLCIVGGAIRPVKRDEFTDLMLEDLSLEDAERLWKRLREFDEEEGLGGSTVVGRACPGPPQDEAGAGAPALQERVEEWWAEVGPRWKAIYEMSGGNPRLLIMLYRAFEEGDVEDVRLELSRLVDESTPYFKAITESLPETDQRVLSAIVHVGERVRPIEIEQATGVEERTLRLSLGRLREAGLVQEQKENGASLYSLRQRFYRTWLRMRMQAGTRYETLWFVDLLRLLYVDPAKWFKARLRFAAEYELAVTTGDANDARRAREMLRCLAHVAPANELKERLLAGVVHGEQNEVLGWAQEAVRAASERGDRDSEASARVAAGLAWGLLGHREEAAKELEHAVRLKPDLEEAHCKLGHTYRLLGRAEEAVEELREAMRLMPGCAYVHNELGRAYGTLEWHDRAVEEFQKAIRLEPEFASAHLNLGIAYWNLGRDEDAAPAFREALRLEPELVPAHHGLALSYLALELYENAAQEFRAAIQIDPRYTDAHHGLVDVCGRLGRDEEALESCANWIRLTPDHPAAHAHMGLLYQHLGLHEEATRSFRTAAGLFRGEAAKGRCGEPLLFAGRYWAMAGDLQDADADFRKGLADTAAGGAPEHEEHALAMTAAMEAAMKQRWMAVVEAWVEEGVRVMPEAKGFFEPWGWAVDFVVKGPGALVRRQDEEVRAVQLILERADLKKEAGEVGKILERRMSGLQEVNSRKASAPKKRRRKKEA